jgi:hypothetical protein
MSVELVISAAVLGVVTVFVIMFRSVNRRFDQRVPHAVVTSGGERWVAGQGRARMARRADIFMRVAIAVGLTSVVVMSACMIGMIALAIIART